MLMLFANCRPFGYVWPVAAILGLRRPLSGLVERFKTRKPLSAQIRKDLPNLPRQYG